MVMWIWNNDKFISLESESKFVNLAANLKFYPSKSAAQKGIEKGELYWMLAEKGHLVKVGSWKQEIPKAWPVVMALKKPYPRWVTVMIPDNQGCRQWTRIWNEQSIRWRDEALDWAEEFIK